MMVLSAVNPFQRGLLLFLIVILIGYYIDSPAKLLSFKSSLKMPGLQAGDRFPEGVNFSSVFAVIACRLRQLD